VAPTRALLARLSRRDRQSSRMRVCTQLAVLAWRRPQPVMALQHIYYISIHKYPRKAALMQPPLRAPKRRLATRQAI
jgi:hypothetical protein